MTGTDVFWAVGWFFTGLFVFQVRGIKSFFDFVSTVFSIFSLLMLLFNPTPPNPLIDIFVSIGLGYISGIFTLTIYLIGANISRYYQFGEMSPRIWLYIFSAPIWAILQTIYKK